MTPEQQNIAIEEFLGGPTHVGLKKRGLWYRSDAKGYTSDEALAGRYTLEEAKEHEYVHGEEDDVTIVQFKSPDYPNDLNACHEMEMTLDDAQYHTFTLKLAELSWRVNPHQVDDHAYKGRLRIFVSGSAAQRCEAFLKTTGKWVE